MDNFVSQLDAGALKELLDNTVLKGTALIQVGEKRHIENMNEEGKRVTGLHPMSIIDEILSIGACTALRDCIENKVSHTIMEELDEKIYELHIVPNRKGALLAYLVGDRSVFDGSLRIIQEQSASYIRPILEFAGELEKSDKENANKLRKQCLKMKRMFSHSEFLHEPPVMGQLDLKLNDISKICRLSAKAVKEIKGKEIKLSIPPSCIVLSEQKLIRMALYNLLSNAIKSVPKEKEEENEVILSLSPGPEFIKLTVSDRGEGMNPKFYESAISGWRRPVSIDEYYYFAREKAPLGFGLPIVNYVAQLHGGSLMFSKREGGGSEFHMTIAKNLEISNESGSLGTPAFVDDGYELEDIEFSVL